MSKLLLDSYQQFRQLLRSPQVNPDHVYTGIVGLRLVDVTLTRGVDNPQLVFESLNSTGVDLSQSDLVRNYLLMGLSEAEQTKLYNNYWSKLEDDFRRAGSVPDTFLRDYVALKQEKSTQARADEIYNEFKDFHESGDATETESLLADMVRFGRHYAAFLWPDRIDSKALREAMYKMHGGGIGSTHAMLVMRLYDCYQQGQLSEDDFAQALVLIKSYLVRRAVTRLQTRGYWGFFARTAFAISDDDPIKSLQVAFARRGYSYRFPSDEEFRKALREVDLYSLLICFHLLEQLENAGEEVKSPTTNCSVEHILPQSIDKVPEWQAMIADNGSEVEWQQVHEKWVHSLGNLTLVGYNANSALSNRPFADKKNMKGGFKESPARLNYDVRDQETWTAKQIDERCDRLAKRALQIWPHHGADMQLVQDANVRQLQDLAAQKSSGNLEMSVSARTLLTAITGQVQELGEVIEVVESQSVCLYDDAARFFAEILPRSNALKILLPLEFDEVENSEGLAENAAERKYFRGAAHRGCGVHVTLGEMDQIQATMVIIRQAFDLREG